MIDSPHPSHRGVERKNVVGLYSKAFISGEVLMGGVAQLLRHGGEDVQGDQPWSATAGRSELTWGPVIDTSSPEELDEDRDKAKSGLAWKVGSADEPSTEDAGQSAFAKARCL